MSKALGLASLNSRTNETIRPDGWENEIAVLQQQHWQEWQHKHAVLTELLH